MNRSAFPFLKALGYEGFSVADVVEGGGVTIDEWCAYLAYGTLPDRAKVTKLESEPMATVKSYQKPKSDLGQATLQTVFRSVDGCTRSELADVLRIPVTSVNGVVGGHVAKGWLKSGNGSRFLITEAGVKAFERLSQ